MPGTVVSDRGGYVGRWGVACDDNRVHHASTRDLTVLEKVEEDPIVEQTVEKIDPIEWEKRSKESLQNILKRYS